MKELISKAESLSLANVNWFSLSCILSITGQFDNLFGNSLHDLPCIKTLIITFDRHTMLIVAGFIPLSVTFTIGLENVSSIVAAQKKHYFEILLASS